jgi:hypothetical protein
VVCRTQKGESMRYNVVVCALVVAALAFSPACNKKGKQSVGKNNSGIPEMSKKTSSDTGDIFKEFYSDDTSGQGASKKTSGKSASKNHTFSPSSTSPSASGEFVENGRYVVQVACVQSKSFAAKMVSTLKEKNFPAYTAEVQNPTPALTGTFYRIRIGGFSGHTSAKSFGDNTLKPAGYDYWVDKKSNDNTGMEGYGLGKGATDIAPAANSAVSPTSSWSSPAPEPAGSPSSSLFGQSDGNASSSAAMPSSSPNTAAAPVVSGNTSSNNPNTPAASPATPAPAIPPASPTAHASTTPPPPTPAAKTSASPAVAPTTPASATPAPGKVSSGTSAGTAAESNDWGTDSTSASPSSSGW